MDIPPIWTLPALKGRGVRKLDDRRVPKAGAADVDPILIKYSWELDNGADANKVEYSEAANTITLKSSYSFKYRFEQVTVKRSNLEPDSLLDTSAIVTTPTQGAVRPQVNEVSVVHLPAVFDPTDFVSGEAEWQLEDIDMVDDTENEYYQTVNVMKAETHWMEEPLKAPTKEVIHLEGIAESRNYTP